LWAEERKVSYIRVQDRTVQASREVWELLRKSRVPRDTVFTYGKKEEVLMKFLEERGRITLKEFSKAAGIPFYMASKTLVRLAAANVLQLHPQESEDFFTLKD
jgi:hypothetical protein